MSSNNNYTTRQAASIGLQPGNLVGETHYVTESQITPPIKQRVRNTKLLTTNISRCQCCCPPFASFLCRSCLCPCWAYLLVGLFITLLLAGLAVEIGFLSREKVIYKSLRCTERYNSTYLKNETNGTEYFVGSSTSKPCPVDGTVVGASTTIFSSFTYLFIIINLLIYSMKF